MSDGFLRVSVDGGIAAPVVIVVCGVSGAGKSTIGALLAERLGWEFLEADDFHPPSNVDKMHRGEPLSDEDRWPWLDALRQHIERCLRDGRPTVVACSALRSAYRDHLGIDQRRVISVFLEGPPSLIAARIARRANHFMPGSLLDSQFSTLEPPRDGLRVDVDAPPDVVVDRIVADLADASGDGG